MKNKEEQKESVLGVIKKYKVEEKQNLLRRKKFQREIRDRICRCSLRAHRLFFMNISSGIDFLWLV